MWLPQRGQTQCDPMSPYAFGTGITGSIPRPGCIAPSDTAPWALDFRMHLILEYTLVTQQCSRCQYNSEESFDASGELCLTFIFPREWENIWGLAMLVIT